jgi:hypothetical protein
MSYQAIGTTSYILVQVHRKKIIMEFLHKF